MPINLSQVPSDSPVGQAKKGAKSNTSVVPFARASKWHTEQGVTANNINIDVAAPGTYNFTVPSYGFLSAILLTVTATGGASTPAVVFYEDAPWSLIQSITVSDVNGTPIFGPVNGYDAYLMAKFGAYRLFPLDSASAYSVNTANGDFSFILPIYAEFGRDGLGCLPNMDASARYQVQIILGSGVASSSGPVYTTAPGTTYPTVSMQVEGLYRSQPPAVDMSGNHNSTTPPAVGTIQYVTKQTFSSLSGTQTLQLSRVGNLIRNHILVFRDAANNTRTTAAASDMPTLIEFDWDAGQRYVENVLTRHLLNYTEFGFAEPAGVIVYPNTTDTKLPLSEYGDEWMATVGATKLTLRFTPAASVNLTVITNDIVPKSADVYAAPAAQIAG